MLKKVIPSVLIVIALTAFAPHAAEAGFQGGLNFALGFPQGEFGDQVDKTGYGLSGQLALGLPVSVISLGASGGFIIYGKEQRIEPFSTTIPDVTVKVETQNSLFTGHLFLRVQPPFGPFKPYLDGLFGFHHLRTDTKIKDEDEYDSEEIASSNNFKDTVMSYGVGGGLMLRLYKSPTSAAGVGKSVELYLDIGARYLKGGEAEYLKEGSIRRSDGQVAYDVTQSETDLLFTYVGITASF